MANDPESLLVLVVKNCRELAAAKQLRRVARSTRATKMAKEKKMPRELRSKDQGTPGSLRLFKSNSILGFSHRTLELEGIVLTSFRPSKPGP